MTPLPESSLESRRLVYGLLVTVAAGLTLGRVASAEYLHEPSVTKADGSDVPRPAWKSKRPEPWPTFSSNDRSRWALARALVDEGTWVIGRRDPSLPVPKGDSGVVFEDGFGTVDKVLHPERLEFYSTKPPLLSVVVAGEYWVLKKAFGWDIVRDRFLVVRTILVLTNVLPLILYLWLMSKLAEEFGGTDWGKFYVVAAAGFGTLVTPFLVSLNNHTVATAAATVALYAVVRVTKGGGAGWFPLAGLAAGFAACNDLPALSLAAALGVYLVWKSPARALGLYLPAVLLVIGAEVALSYAQTGQVLPTYTKFGSEWYTYEGSHWLPPGQTKRGIDYAGRNGETKDVYAFHLLLGHHGWFSLTPVMVLALAGMLWSLGRRDRVAPVAMLTALLSAVVIGFYLVRSDNYGGWSNGPRWLMWLTPLWLLCLPPLLDRLAPSRLGRGVALLLLAVSVLSVSYQFWNPWRHPWIYNWLESLGRINY